MNSLNIDFRDGCLRILATKDGSVRYSKLIKDFSLDDRKSAKETLVLSNKRIWREKRKGQYHSPFRDCQAQDISNSFNGV